MSKSTKVISPIRPDGSPRPPCNSTNAEWIAEAQDRAIRLRMARALPGAREWEEDHRRRVHELRAIASEGFVGARAPFGGGYDG